MNKLQSKRELLVDYSCVGEALVRRMRWHHELLSKYPARTLLSEFKRDGCREYMGEPEGYVVKPVVVKSAWVQFWDRDAEDRWKLTKTEVLQ